MAWSPNGSWRAVRPVRANTAPNVRNGVQCRPLVPTFVLKWLKLGAPVPTKMRTGSSSNCHRWLDCLLDVDAKRRPPIREPVCSMCLAMNPDRLKPGQRCASTSNRNFEGRQGDGGLTHLVSPAMAAAAAIARRLWTCGRGVRLRPREPAARAEQRRVIAPSALRFPGTEKSRGTLAKLAPKTRLCPPNWEARREHAFDFTELSADCIGPKRNGRTEWRTGRDSNPKCSSTHLTLGNVGLSCRAMCARDGPAICTASSLAKRTRRRQRR